MKPLFIFEIANNHNGSIEHGKQIIQEIKEVIKEFDYDFAFKLQYRNINTFIHPDYRNRYDIKYVKRFLETELKDNEFLELKKEMSGCKTICTPFDESSVRLIGKHDFDIVKIASCSFTDWPLLEEIAKLNKPVIASTASNSIDDIDNVVIFFENRNIDLSLCHCIGKYPTERNELNMNCIDELRYRFPLMNIGYSGHEIPYNYMAIQSAIAKGCTIFERHVAVGEKNRYSSSPEEIRDWLYAAQQAFTMCGSGDIKRDDKLNDLKRGVFAKHDIVKGQKINREDIFYSIPPIEGQLLANDLSKYIEVFATEDIEKNKPLIEIRLKDSRKKITKIISNLKEMIKVSGVKIPNNVEIELSHHYGLDKYGQWGVAIIDCINREYCKKLLIMQPKQRHPKHHHVKKEETFHILWGDLTIYTDKTINLKEGAMFTVERNVSHGFSSNSGCVFEEVSTTHFKNDSYYEDEVSSDRKTRINYWLK